MCIRDSRRKLRIADTDNPTAVGRHRSAGKVKVVKDKILVVDDMEMNREILRGIFEDDYEVILAENGREAVEYINLNRGKLAAILLDIVMPEMDGFGVLDYMHEQELMMSVPVILITSDTSSESRKRGYDLGVSAVSYTHLRAHETRHDLVCRLLLEKKKTNQTRKNHLRHLRTSRNTLPIPQRTPEHK